MCIFIKAVITAAETQNTLALLNDYLTAYNFSVIEIQILALSSCWKNATLRNSLFP